MVVLSVAILNKSGKPLLSRQMVEMTRIRIEGLLAAFPKLKASDKQHTYVETENVRYLYQPLESLFLVLVTTKKSNIIEDLETLRLLSKVVPEYAEGLSEEQVLDHSFELIFAFDEVIANGGFNEHISLDTVRTNLEMDSHEEKLSMMIRASKESEARDIMKRKAVEIREIREMHKEGPGAGAMRGVGGGVGSGGVGSDTGIDAGVSFASPAGGASAATAAPFATSAAAAPAEKPRRVIKSGMRLGKGGKTSAMMRALAAEDGISVAADGEGAAAAAGGASAAAAATAASAPVVAEGVVLRLEEKFSAQCLRDGGLESMDVKGTLSLLVNDPERARVVVRVVQGANPGFQFQSHPHIDKKRFAASSELALRDPSKSFPAGTALSILRWRFSRQDDSLLPLTINCWPEETRAGVMNVNIEYSLEREEMELHDVVVAIPLGTASEPQVGHADGTYKHNAKAQMLEWRIDSIDSSNSTGTLEFSIAQKSDDAFFPVEVSFHSMSTLCDVQVGDVVSADGGEHVRHSTASELTVDTFTVG